MTVLRQVYKSMVCGNIAEVLRAGQGSLVCYGQDRILKKEDSAALVREMHVPVTEKADGGILVKVGAVEHPSSEAHFIEWIEIQTMNRVYRAYLYPSEHPRVLFTVDEAIMEVRAYCNLHGLWKA